MRGSQPTVQPVVSSTATAPNAGSGPSLRRLSAARAPRALLGGALEVLQPGAERAIERPGLGSGGRLRCSPAISPTHYLGEGCCDFVQSGTSLNPRRLGHYQH